MADAMVKVLIPDQIAADLAAGGHADYLAVETNGKSGLPVGAVRAVPASGIQGLKKRSGTTRASLADATCTAGHRSVAGRDLRQPAAEARPRARRRQETPCLTSDHVGTPKRHNTTSFPYIGSRSNRDTLFCRTRRDSSGERYTSCARFAANFAMVVFATPSIKRPPIVATIR